MGLLSSLIFSSFALSAQFSTGTTFEATPYFGVVQVFCPASINGPMTKEFSCRKSSLSPRETDYFNGPTGVDADKVVFTNRLENRTQRTRSENYDPLQARSALVNLWQESFFQAPLLSTGLNNIRYQLLKSRSVVYEGNFTVQVVRKNTVRCVTKQMIGYGSNDCENQVWACESYFADPLVCP
jgi:hypothetical protein